ncbi:EthD family reductase [Mesorhizobium erdmanii]|uniref:EthD family reductase n=1 Tax=Mesorhizobium erdmanii TaxID=1777866 RepID=A0A6M7UK13_9HYPH|nr:MULTISPECIES: EthD family reductase [Mesorhizobium]OBQ73324.1 ethD like-protein [Mesorhizobium loti]QKC76483.1 EthD family reductase [Mesorhizobium erdmanii]
MASLVVTYGTPENPEAFDAYYREKHIPLAKTIPGLRRYEISRGPVMTPAGPAKAHLIAILRFDDLAAIQNAFASAEGQAAAADLQVFATGGADMLIFDTEDV